MSEHTTHEQIHRSLLIFGLLVSLGCTRAEPTNPTIEPQGRVESNSVEVTIVDRAEFDAALVRFKGQVVLLDCWATWCLPCVAQLPHSMELAERLGSQGLRVATLSFDDLSRIDAVSKLLSAKGGGAGTHFICKNGGGSKAMEEFEITGGALPHYKLFDRTGKLIRTFAIDPSAERQFTVYDIDQAVKELLSHRDG
jgi:thiol-disulfide isomerase/thioredoxin